MLRGVLEHPEPYRGHAPEAGLVLAAKLLLQTITKELTLQCATRRGFREVCSFVRSFILSIELQRPSLTSETR